MTSPSLLVLDSITKLPPGAKGAVAVAGSHGGVFCGYLAARAGLRAVILNDAGLGLDEAGVSGLAYLEKLGIPAASIGHETARIGDGPDMMKRGKINRANASAAALGVRGGQACADAAALLQRAEARDVDAPSYEESRFLFREGTPAVWGLDSNSLVRPDDAGAVVVTGSHGALLSGKPETAISVAALAAVYHDAGIGIDRAGVSRLPALDARGIAGACVAGATARIGDARSLWASGRLSAVNETAKAWGAREGMTVPEFADIALRHAR